MDEETCLPFREALLELLKERRRYLKLTGTVNLAAFVRDLDGIRYEALRRVLVEEREPSFPLLKCCAQALNIPVTYFREARLHLASEALMRHEEDLEDDELRRCVASFLHAASEVYGRHDPNL